MPGSPLCFFFSFLQFIGKACDQLEGKVKPGTKGISLIKGVDVKEGEIHIFSEVISARLGIECAALSGANIADEVAREEFSETTIGCRDLDVAKKWASLFETEKFRVAVNRDVLGVSLGGALKNIVAVAAGFVDGLQWGNNAKVSSWLLHPLVLLPVIWSPDEFGISGRRDPHRLARDEARE